MPPMYLRMCAEGRWGALQTPLQTLQHHHAQGSLSLGSVLQEGRGGGTAPSPHFSSTGALGTTPCAPWGNGGPLSSKQPWAGRSFSRPASAEVLAAIGTGAAEPVAWQQQRVLFPMTNIISIDPDHLLLQMSARAGEHSKGEHGSLKRADSAPFHHSGDAGTLALSGCTTGEFIQLHCKQNAVALGNSARVSTKRTSPLKETHAN